MFPKSREQPPVSGGLFCGRAGVQPAADVGVQYEYS